MIRLVVFDMAGTTVDESNVVYQTLHESIVATGFPRTLEQVLEHGVGKEKRQSILDVLALDGQAHAPARVEEIHRDFLRRLRDAYAVLDVKEQPGASAVFRALKERGIAVALNTGHGQEAAESLVARLGWSVGREIDALITASQVPQARPFPDMIHRAQEQLRVSRAACVAKVGDTTFDIEEGRNAGCGLCVGVTTGAHSRERLAAAKPDRIIDDLRELLDLV